jgi:hypothetical protein
MRSEGCWPADGTTRIAPTGNSALPAGSSKSRIHLLSNSDRCDKVSGCNAAKRVNSSDGVIVTPPHVRFGSVATDPFRVSAEQCPLRSESDHHPSRDRLTLPPDLALAAESVSASPSDYPPIVVRHHASRRSASGVQGDAPSRRRVRLWGKSTRSMHGIKKGRNFPSSCLGGAR